jgi:hypothetical protein
MIPVGWWLPGLAVFWVFSIQAQTVCNDLVNISINEACRVVVTPENILQNAGANAAFYTIRLKVDGAFLPANVLTGEHVGKTVQVTVTDTRNNTSCEGNIQVLDRLAPVISCNNFTIPCVLTDYRPATLTALNYISADPSATDNCTTNVTKTYVDDWVNLSCTDVFAGRTDLSGYILRRWQATDRAGNTSTCEQTIFLRKVGLDELRFPEDATVSCTADLNTATLPAATGVPFARIDGNRLSFFPNTGACELNISYRDRITEVCGGSYKILRTWTVISACNDLGMVIIGGTPYQNPLNRTQTIKITAPPPFFVTPLRDTTLSTNPNTCCLSTNLPDVVVSGVCGPVQSVEVTITAYDQHGQQVGTYQPAATVRLSDFPGNNRWKPDTLAVVGTTNVCLPIGRHAVFYTVTDLCGQKTTASFWLTIKDFAPPTARCIEFATVSLNRDDPNDRYTGTGDAGCNFGGVVWSPATLFDKGSSDNCGKVRFTVRRMTPSTCISGLNNRSDQKEDDGNPANDDEYYRIDRNCKDFEHIFDADDDGLLTEYELAISENDSIKFYCCEAGSIQNVIVRVYQVDPKTGECSKDINGELIYDECMVQVTVQEKLRPVCIAPRAVETTCENFDPALTAYGNAQPSDNCCLDCTKSYQGVRGITHNANYTQFDTVCARGTITRTWTVFDCHGQSNRCSQQIVVTNSQDFYIKFPDDVIATFCDSTTTFGKPTFYGKECDLLAVSFKDEEFVLAPDACRKIERTWTVVNWCNYNPNAPCVNIPNPEPFSNIEDPRNLAGPIVAPRGTPIAGWAPTITPLVPGGPNRNFGDFWNSTVNCYKYKQIIRIRDRKPPEIVRPIKFLEVCDITTNDPQLWNDMRWWDSMVSTHDLCEGPVDVCLTAFDDCSGGNLKMRYLLFLDLDQDGTRETVINSNAPPPPGTVYFNNVNTPGYTGGELRVFDKRTDANGNLLPADDRYQFTVQTSSLGQTGLACIRWTTKANPNRTFAAQVPHGRHNIKWYVSDNCGNEIATEYDIVIRDCKKPSVLCTNGLSVNLMNSRPPMATVFASDFVVSSEDNCTPTNQLVYSMKKQGPVRINEFPLDANGKPITTLQWDCNEVGQQFVEVWIKDKAGNFDNCLTFVRVQDPNRVCPPTNVPLVAGRLLTEKKQGVEEANVRLNYFHPATPAGSLSTYSDKTGNFHFSDAVPLRARYTITPFKNDNPLNGVTTFDIALISKHMLGIDPLGSPYKLIAADVNNSGSITNFDVVEIRRLILGIYDNFPSVNSWRFVDKKHIFSNPDNPFEQPFPERIADTLATGTEVDEQFVSIKIGDVDDSAVANALQEVTPRSNAALALYTEDCAFRPNDRVEAVFNIQEPIMGYQFTLQMNGLQLIDLVPLTPGMDKGHFAVFKDENAFTTSWNSSRNAEMPRFKAIFKGQTEGTLHQSLRLSHQITHAEGYTAVGETAELALVFGQVDGANITTGVGVELYQNQPNPFSERTTIRFNLPEATDITLSVFDETGRLCHRQEGYFTAGYHAISLSADQVKASSGVLFYRLDTNSESITRKLVLLRN